MTALTVETPLRPYAPAMGNIPMTGNGLEGHSVNLAGGEFPINGAVNGTVPTYEIVDVEYAVGTTQLPDRADPTVETPAPGAPVAAPAYERGNPVWWDLVDTTAATAATETAQAQVQTPEQPGRLRRALRHIGSAATRFVTFVRGTDGTEAVTREPYGGDGYTGRHSRATYQPRHRSAGEPAQPPISTELVHVPRETLRAATANMGAEALLLSGLQARGWDSPEAFMASARTAYTPESVADLRRALTNIRREYALNLHSDVTGKASTTYSELTALIDRLSSFAGLSVRKESPEQTERRRAQREQPTDLATVMAATRQQFRRGNA